MKKILIENKKIREAGAILALALFCALGGACGKGQKAPEAVPTEGTTEAVQTKVPETTLTTAPTDTPTNPPTNTPISVPTNTPTNTPIPEGSDMAKLMDQHDEKVDSSKYKEVYELFSQGDYGYPVINITTLDSAPVYKSATTVLCMVDTFNCPEDYKISRFAQIRVRGNSSAAPSKGAPTDSNREKYPNESYPYKIKFEEKENLFGLNSGNKFKDWVLLEMPSGRPLENIYAFSLAQVLHGGKYYASDACLVHVYLNGNYMGMYTLCEQSEAKKNRVNVNEPKEGYTGTDIGYFIEIDNYADSQSNDKPYFRLYHEKAVVTDIQGVERKLKHKLYTIHSDITSDEQQAFIKNYLDSVFKIIYEAVEHQRYLSFDENWQLVEGKYNSSKECIAAVMDLDSVVCSYLVEEITLDVDRGEGSFYMAVDFSEKSKYEKLTFLCPWDFEWGYFGAGTFPNKQYALFAAAFDNMFYEPNGDDRSNPWFILLIKEEWFREMVCEKWEYFYEDGALTGLEVELEEYSEKGKNDIVLGRKITWLNDYMNLVSLCRKRIDWLNDNWFGRKS